MRLTTKYHLILIFALLISLVIISATSYYFLQKYAREEVSRQASVLLDTALAMSKYTSDEIKPLLVSQNQRDFLPQSVPSYAATQNFEALRKTHPEYSYKEATLNPTNPRDRAVDWEADIIQEFRNNSKTDHISLVRDTPEGATLYYARPIQIQSESCLTCHGIVGDAPKSMVDLYGIANGFGWKMNEVVGSQVVSIPLGLAVKNANAIFYVLTSVVAGIFLIIYLMLIFIYKKYLIHQPLTVTSAVETAILNEPATQKIMTTQGKMISREKPATLEISAIPERSVYSVRDAYPEKNATPERNVTLERASAPQRNTTPERNVTLERASTPEKNAAPERNVTLERAPAPERNAAPERSVTPKKKSILDTKFMRGRTNTQSETLSLSESVEQTGNIFQEVDVTQDKQERPTPVQTKAENPTVEDNISLEGMYHEFEMDTSFLDEAFELEDVITELTVNSTQGRD